MQKQIAFSGKMGSGKSTTLKELAKYFSYKGVAIGGEIKPLAALLIENRKGFEKQLERIIPDQSQREASIKEIYEFFDTQFSDAVWEKDEKGIFIKNPAYRKLLQDFPMLVRQHFGEEVFAKLMVAGLETDIQNGISIICDDLRLPNEKELFEQNGFYIIRFDISEEEQKRRLIETYGTYDEAALKHRTEIALDDTSFDIRIDVTGKPVPDIVKEIQVFLNSVEDNQIK